MNNKIPYKRFRGEKYDKQGNVFDEMKAVSLDELQSLSKNELDTIPMAWLYDWAHVNGLAGYIQVQEWLESLQKRREKPRKLQISQKQNAVVFAGYIDNRYMFHLYYRKSGYNASGYRKCELYKGYCYVDGKRFTVTDEQMRYFCKAYYKFEDDFEKAKKQQDGFHSVSKDGNTIFFKRLPNFDYQFFSQLANGDIRQDSMKIKQEVVEFNFLGMEKSNRLRWDGQIPKIDEDYILLNTDDEYLNNEIKHMCCKATKEDIEYLNSFNKISILYVDEKVYSEDDIIITKTERVRPTFFNRSRRYLLSVEIQGKEFLAVYYYEGEKDVLYILSHIRIVEIDITPELRKSINEIINNLQDDYKNDIAHFSFRRG